jgi:succinoglycan biosynthesis protein ExoL
VRIDIRGRPSPSEFDDFEGQVAAAPGVTFGGPYRPEALTTLYGAVHLNWAIDWFQDEGNSRWLLPNRLYEGGRQGVPVIARRDSETGRWLAARGLGVLLDRPEDELEAFLDALTPEAWAALRARHGAAPANLFVLDLDDCRRLAAALAGGDAPATASALATAAA